MRIPALDYIRVISTLGIVSCHVCYGIDLGLKLWGRFLGQTFNSAFFALSALLLGLAWNYKRRPVYTFGGFLLPRLARLIFSLWPFLIVAFIFLAVCGETFSPIQMVLNFSLLSWLGRMGGFGHLWFLTMLTACYFMFLLLSKQPFAGMPKWAVVTACSMLTIVQWQLDECMLPGYAIQILIFSALLFVNAGSIKMWLDRLTFVGALLPYLLITIGFMVFHLRGGFYTHRFLSFTFASISGISQVAFGYAMLRRVKSSRFVTHLSTISFEVCLIHCPLCYGPYSLFCIIESKALAMVYALALTLAFSEVLHIIASKFRGSTIGHS